MDFTKEIERVKAVAENAETKRDRELLRAVMKGRTYAQALLLIGEYLLDIGATLGGEEEAEQSLEKAIGMLTGMINDGVSPTGMASISGGLCLILATIAFLKKE